MQGARRLREVGVRCEAGRFWLLWMNVFVLDASVCCRGVLGAWSSCEARASGALSAFSSATGSPQLVVIPPGVLRVDYGVARGAARRFFLHAHHRRELDTRIITHFHQGFPPPRPVASLWSNQGRVLTGVRFRTDTRRSSPESIEQANQPTEELQNRTKGTETPTD